MDLRTLVIITVCIQCAQGIFIPSSTRDFRKKAAAAASTETKYSNLLRDLAVIKLKLETMSYGPVYLEGPYDSDSNNGPMAKSLKDTDSPATVTAAAEDPTAHFNEMAVLELIPVIIEQKRRGNVSPDEETTLKEIFGDLWIVIEEEVNRTKDEEMNPILKALLQSNNDSRLKRALVQQHMEVEEDHHHQQQQQLRQQRRRGGQYQNDEESTGLDVEVKNDIFGNSVDRVRVTRWPKSFVAVNPSQLSPQQRLMRHAAFQIRQWLDYNNGPKKMGSFNGRGGLKRNNYRLNKNRRTGNKRRGPPRQQALLNRRMRKNGGNKNRGSGAGAEGRMRKRQNLRPKRHNTDIYVDDNHGYFDYADFDDDSFDDVMTKPRTMRSSRMIFDEFDSTEEDNEELEEEYED